MTNPDWIDAAVQDGARNDDVIAVLVAGRESALFGVEGEVFATDNNCTRGRARLSKGLLLGQEIECPLHQGRFDIRSGAPTCAPVAEAIRSCPAKIESCRAGVALA